MKYFAQNIMSSEKLCWRIRWKWVVLWSLWAARFVRQPTSVVRVSGGALRGSLAIDGTHKMYTGIPYASTDLQHRFQAPGPEPQWDGVFEAIEENIRCHQKMKIPYVIGQTNCLVLNVYTPLNIPSDTKLPVMVFIHGGGFYDGSATKTIYGPEYLVAKDVILVTINYRLNIQGFLCLGIKEAPGNAGLKDQVAALKWVQTNIKTFGGDPSSVTIFGESAGAASVSYHLLSPMSKNLFHKAILQSGSSLASWSYQHKPVYRASLLAKVHGFLSKDARELYNHFMSWTDEKLVLTRVPRQKGNILISELLYVPCIEKVFDGVEPFLINNPYDIYEKGNFNKVPILIGSNSAEGLLLGAAENDTVLTEIDVSKSLPNNLKFPSDEVKYSITEQIKNTYEMHENIGKNYTLNLSRYLGEAFFNYPTLAETEFILRYNNYPVYSYLFNYSGKKNLAKNLLGEPFKSVPGATHADDLFYLFKQSFMPSSWDTHITEIMSTMWTNFAKYGEPTPEVSELIPQKWKPAKKENPQSLLIDNDISLVPMWFKESLKYWHEVYSKYKRKA